MNNVVKINLPVIALVASLFSGTVNATPILTIAEAGGFDTFLASVTLASSGQSVEEAWVASVLNVDLNDISLSFKDSNGATPWQKLSDGDEDEYYYDFGANTDPEYFLVKLGNGGNNINHSHYLFQNVGDLQYAVVRFLDAGVDFSLSGIGIDRISHTSEFSYDDSGITTNSFPAPEPSSIALLALGALGIGWSRRYTMRAGK
jgi:hypothetical protein